MHAVGQFQAPSSGPAECPTGKRAGGRRRSRGRSLEANARRLELKLADFGVEGEVVEILPGPVITMYEFKPAPGIKISKIAGALR